MDGTLVLENGMVFHGNAFGSAADATFELVFNTSLTGYQEILTDPSYRGQAVLFTAPHIGNVGINMDDYEANIPQVSAVVVRSISPIISNWRAFRPLPDWLEEFSVPGISGLDTRRITRILRDTGTMRAAISTKGTPVSELLSTVRKWPGLDGVDMVKLVTCSQPNIWQLDSAGHWVETELMGNFSKNQVDNPLVVLYDFGAKRNISRHLFARGLNVLIVPAEMPFEELTNFQPIGIVLSNGPGDPAGLPNIVANIKKIIDSNIPVLGICLGHQLIGLATGGKTSRLKFGHHGGNHPVLHVASGKSYITSQNHNYAVDINSLETDLVEVTYLSLNDQTLEGMRLRNHPVLSVQFHPEAAPGPHDAQNIFDEFLALLK